MAIMRSSQNNVRRIKDRRDEEVEVISVCLLYLYKLVAASNITLAVKVSERAMADNASSLGTPRSPKNDPFNILMSLFGVKFQPQSR
jgi:hypothetical protein